MTLKKHKKHADICKPFSGKFHRSEFALMGAPCGLIQKLATDLANEMNNELKLSFMDADHSSNGTLNPFHSQYTDKIEYHRVDFNSDYPEYDLHKYFIDSDLLLINGNHFKANNQIVIINEKKKDSLERKLDRLTNVLCFVLDEGQDEIYKFLIDHNPGFKEKPVYRINDIQKIVAIIQDQLNRAQVGLKGLVLAGGRSTRMGKDKTVIKYHGKPHREFLMDLLNNYCSESYLSIAHDQESEMNYIKDSFLGLGPYGGILSAFRMDPNSAWLTVASDIPLLDKETLEFLCKKRNPGKYATCFHNPETNFPEPLITIWEPKMYPRLLEFLSKGYSCPRKALINSEIEELEIPDHKKLFNANTPKEVEQAFNIING